MVGIVMEFGTMSAYSPAAGGPVPPTFAPNFTPINKGLVRDQRVAGVRQSGMPDCGSQEDDGMTMDAPEHGPDTDPIDFALRFANSETFRNLFREGMGLVEETASYLDGPGRAESKELGRAGSLIYATESMRLTTRLMQLASWLLLQRAVNEGEMTQAQAGIEKAKVRIDGPSSSRSGPGWDEIPDALKELIDRSIRLQERIRMLDTAIYTEEKPQVVMANPVADQMGRLSDAFGSFAR